MKATKPNATKKWESLIVELHEYHQLMIQEKAEESLGVGALIDEDVTVSLNKLLPFKELALVHMAEYKQNMQAGLETHICA